MIDIEKTQNKRGKDVYIIEGYTLNKTGSMFYAWLVEAQSIGLIVNIVVKPVQFLLTDKIAFTRIVKLKTKTSLKKLIAVRKIVYGADFSTT